MAWTVRGARDLSPRALRAANAKRSSCDAKAGPTSRSPARWATRAPAAATRRSHEDATAVCQNCPAFGRLGVVSERGGVKGSLGVGVRPR
jgi:hypothetical protein